METLYSMLNKHYKFQHVTIHKGSSSLGNNYQIILHKCYLMMMMIPSELKHAEMLRFSIKYKYLRKNIVLLVGWVFVKLVSTVRGKNSINTYFRFSLNPTYAHTVYVETQSIKVYVETQSINYCYMFRRPSATIRECTHKHNKIC